MSQDDYDRFTAPKAEREILDGQPAKIAFGVDPVDGLPRQMAEANFDIPAALTEENFICMADKRSFVLRHPSSWEVQQSFSPDQVKRNPRGDYYVLRELVSEDVITARQAIGWATGDLCYVEPIRPQCVHLFRQMTDLTADRDRKFIQRACLRQKTEEGEYYSLRDMSVYACGIREPRHAESEEKLDAFDHQKLIEARERKADEDLDLDAEIEKHNLGVLGTP